MDKLIVNKVELLLDATDADVLQTLQEALPACIAKCGKIKDEQCAELDKIRKMCAAVRDCFDAVFGDGTAAKVIKHPNSLDECVAAFQQLNSQLQLLTKKAASAAKAAVKAAEKA